MGLIMKEIEIIGDKGRQKAKTLFDSGASDSLIRKNVAEDIATTIKRPEPIEFILGDGRSTIKAQYFTAIDFVIKDCTFPSQRVIVVDELEEDLIIGADALQRWKIKLDMENEDVIIDKSVLRLRLVTTVVR